MDSRTGDLYPDREQALAAGVPEKSLVEIFGEARAIKRVSTAVKYRYDFEKAKKRRKQQRASRRRNR